LDSFIGAYLNVSWLYTITDYKWVNSFTTCAYNTVGVSGDMVYAPKNDLVDVSGNQQLCIIFGYDGVWLDEK
jgi:hypothetical protein